MRRGTTPTYILDLSQVDTSRIADICLAFEQDGNELNLHMSEGRIEIGENSGYATLTQEETNAERQQKQLPPGLIPPFHPYVFSLQFPAFRPVYQADSNRLMIPECADFVNKNAMIL